MNELENRLRDAYSGAAATVNQETVRELRVHDRLAGDTRRPASGRAPVPWARGGLAGWLLPLGAAAAVAAPGARRAGRYPQGAPDTTQRPRQRDTTKAQRRRCRPLACFSTTPACR